MGVDIMQYRVAIGVFNNSVHRSSKRFYLTSDDGGKWSDSLLLGKNICYSIFIIGLLLSLCMDVHPNPGPVRLNSKKMQFKNISFCHVNIAGLKSDPERFNSIKLQLAGNYGVITVSETHLTNVDKSEDYKIPGYHGPYRLDRIGQVWGGVMAWVSNDIAPKRRSDLECYGLEVMWMELRTENFKLLLATAYKQPKGKLGDKFWSGLQDSFDLAKSSGIDHIVLTGDFNSDRQTDQA